MKRILLALALSLAPAARADLIPWQYSWTPSPVDVQSDTGNSHVHFVGQGWTPMLGDSDIPAATLTTVITAAHLTSDTFTGRGYSVTLSLKDHYTGAIGSLTFTGLINGTLSPGSSLLDNTFTGLTTQTANVGDTKFVVTINQFVPPGKPGNGTPGSIGARAFVTVEAIIQDLPEPGTFALAGLGVSAFWLIRRKKKRTAQA
jgi:hypothetical protein